MIDVSAVARVVGITTEYKDLRGGNVLFLQQRIAVVAQGSTASVYATTKWAATSAGAAGTRFGFGSPIHLALRELLPANGDGVGTIPVTVYPLVDDGSGVASTGTITVSGTPTVAGSYRVRIGGVLSQPFVLGAAAIVTGVLAAANTAIAAAINAVLEMPVIAAVVSSAVNVVSKWKGLSANDIKIEVVTDVVSGGATFVLAQPSGGLINPSITAALAQMGNVWETMVLNGATIADTTKLDELQTFGEGRWGELVRKPLVVFTGNTIADMTTATTVSAARRTDRINAQLVAPGSLALPIVVAARQLARIAKVANNNPPTNYTAQRVTGVIPGTDGVQWDQTQRDLAVKAGSSTIEVVDGVIQIADVMTFYRPTGEEPPAYRYVCDIVKLQNIIFNIALIFDAAQWAGAPLIPDDQATVNPLAKKPRMAIAQVAALVDSLGEQALISDPKTVKKSIYAEIDSMNPKRLNVGMISFVSGNSQIIDFALRWGFFFGTPAVVG